MKAKQLFEWNIANSSEGSSASSLPTSTSSLSSLCVREIFASFITAALSIVDIGNTVTREGSHGSRLANSLVSEIAELPTKSQVGPRDDSTNLIGWGD